MYDVNAHLAATDTPNTFLTRTIVRLVAPPVRAAAKVYFTFGLWTNNERIVAQMYQLASEHDETHQ